MLALNIVEAQTDVSFSVHALPSLGVKLPPMPGAVKRFRCAFVVQRASIVRADGTHGCNRVSVPQLNGENLIVMTLTPDPRPVEHVEISLASHFAHVSTAIESYRWAP